MESQNDRLKNLDFVFNPRSIAVVGASNNPFSSGFLYMDYHIKSGFEGPIYPVNPKGGEIMGLQAYTSIKEIPGEVDFAIGCVAAKFVPAMLQDCGEKNVKGVHLFTGRLTETGSEEGAEMERVIAEEAKKAGVRLIGPNCPGLYSPKAKVVTNYDMSTEPGSVAAFLQSGGMSWDFSRYALLRGIRFTNVISFGNAIDINECDLLEYFTQDDETKVIAMYLEGTKDGRRFFEALRAATAVKPVIILKGGKTEAGVKRTFSHTATISGSFNTWEVMIRQCNAIQAKDFSDLLDLTAGFNLLPPITGKKVGVVGGGGGHSVVSGDEVEMAGLDVVDLPEDVRNFVGEREPMMKDWIGNPIDFSMTTGTKVLPHELLKCMTESDGFDFLMCKVTEDLPLAVDGYQEWLKGEVDIYIDVSKSKVKPLTVTVGHPMMGSTDLADKRWQTLFELRESLIQNQIPFFATNNIAAGVVNRVVEYYQKKENK